VEGLTVGEAAARTHWSPRMLRYLELHGLIVPGRTRAGYRVYGLAELNRLRTLRELRLAHGIGIDDMAFAARLQGEPEVRAAVEGWLAAGADRSSWIEWEQRKHERLLVA